jgi:hypothetical protein
MRAVFFLALCLATSLAAALPAVAQGARDRQSDEVTREVLNLRERIRTAAAAKDAAALGALYAETFRHLRDSGRADLKDDRIALLVKGEPTIETAPDQGVEVTVHGAATAIATGTSAIGTPLGRPVPFRWLAVYVKEEGRWRLALSQASRVRRVGR